MLPTGTGILINHHNAVTWDPHHHSSPGFAAEFIVTNLTFRMGLNKLNKLKINKLNKLK